MNIDTETVQRIAHLSRLDFEEKDLEAMKQDLGKILDFMKKLNELDTSGVEPLIYMTGEVNVLRSDMVIQEISHFEAVKNAPKKDSDYFRVPKVIDL